MPRLVHYYDFKYRLENADLPLKKAKEVAPNLFHHPINENMQAYSFVKDGKVHMRLTGYFLSNGEFVMHRTNGIEKAAIKAYELYYQIFHLLACPVHSDSGHSLGGKKIWKKLAAYSDLCIKHYAYDKFAGLEVDFPNQNKEYLPFYRGKDFDKNWNLVTLPIESRFEVTVFPK